MPLRSRRENWMKILWMVSREAGSGCSQGRSGRSVGHGHIGPVGRVALAVAAVEVGKLYLHDGKR